MHDALHQTTESPDMALLISGSESTRLLEGAGNGRGRGWSVGRHIRGTSAASPWTGKGYGIRRPEPDETPLSESEVLHYFRMLPWLGLERKK
jgi:hypothetical protein